MTLNKKKHREGIPQSSETSHGRSGTAKPKFQNSGLKRCTPHSADRPNPTCGSQTPSVVHMGWKNIEVSRTTGAWKKASSNANTVIATMATVELRGHATVGKQLRRQAECGSQWR